MANYEKCEGCNHFAADGYVYCWCCLNGKCERYDPQIAADRRSEEEE